MTEVRGRYDSGHNLTLRPDTLLRFDDVNYSPPTFDDVRTLKETSGETGGELAARTGVDSRTWRRWTAPDGASNASKIPYAVWRLLLLELKIVKG